MEIKTFLFNYHEVLYSISRLISEEFDFSKWEASQVCTSQDTGLKPYIEKIREDTVFVVETNYVDKVYRDSYYHYFSSKSNPYKRNCIRLSIFEDTINKFHFRDFDPINLKELKSKYLGFIVLRPTISSIIGRNIVAPRALRESNFCICSATFHPTANMQIMSVDGFPHSSQDTETMSCAENSIWTLMEYFAHKYAEYKPILPSDIINSLRNHSAERQLPTNGLNIIQISTSLRKFGLAVKIYSRDEYDKNNDTFSLFENLLSCYIESGIPIFLAVSTPKGITPEVNHAIVCIGHSYDEDHVFDALLPSDQVNPTRNHRKVQIFDYDDTRRSFIFSDDNVPNYTKNTLNQPITYNSCSIPSFSSCIITTFVAPLYHKIYLEAFTAKSFVRTFIISNLIPVPDNYQVVLKMHLASCRSFKNFLATTGNETFKDELAEIVLSKLIPKFIWIAYLTTKEFMKKNLATGLIILDATEPCTYNNKPLIFAAYNNYMFDFEDPTTPLTIEIHPFIMFRNLK